jgi:predicted Zn finger-like uncharacterized protein
MLIVCPSCASEYTIGAERIGPTGRVVRCASCREAWFIGPEEVAEQADANAKASGEPQKPATTARSRNGRPTGGNRGTLALSIGLALAMALGVIFRTTVVRIVPESAAVFAMIGLPVNLVGLQLVGVRSDVGREGDAQVLVVSGEIGNETSQPVRVPPIALTIEGEKGATLYSWTDKGGGGELAPHAARPFQARLASPPPDGRQVLVTFSIKAGPGTVASR